MADILLINPTNSYVEKAFKYHYPPLNLLSISRYTQNDYKIKILDQRIEPNIFKKIKKELNKNPIAVGITSQTGEQIKNALDISRFIKKESNVPVIWGGNHISLLPRQTLNNKNIDYGIIGEGEISFYKLIKRLEKNKSLYDIHNIVYKKNNTIHLSKSSPPLKLDNLPKLPYHLVDIKKYILRFKNKKTFALETSRGCPNHCAFCTIQGEKNKLWRGESTKNVITNIQQIIEKYHIKGISFQDMNFFGNPFRAKNILENMSKEFDLFWLGECSTNILKNMNEEYYNLLKKSNCQRLMVGMESGSNRILSEIKKPTNLNDNINISRKLKTHNIPAYYSFIGGFPGETLSELKMTIRLLYKMINENKKAKVSIFHQFRALPGTPLYNKSIEFGFIPPNTLNEWSRYTYGKFINYPWITPEKKKLIELTQFTSTFIDNKYEEIDSKPIKLFAKLYQPIADYRLKNLNTKFFLEKNLKRLFDK